MLYIILFCFIFVIYFLIRHRKNLYSILFSMDMLAIILLLIANILYTLRSNTLSYSSYTEYTLYKVITRIPLSIFDVRTLVNIGVLILIFTSIILFTSGLKTRGRVPREILIIVLYLSFSCYIQLYLNSPDMTEYFYILKIQHPDRSARVLPVLTVVNYVLLFSGVLPTVKFLLEYFRSSIFFKKRHFFMLFFLHTTLYVIFLLILFLMPIKALWNNTDLYNFGGAMKPPLFNLSSTILILLSFLLLVIVFNFNALNEKVFHVNLPKGQSNMLAISDMRHIFHSYKNAMLSIKLLAEKALSQYGSETSMAALQDIGRQADSFLDKATNFLDIYNNVKLKFHTVPITQCIDTACEQISFPEHIRLVRHYPQTPLLFYGDSALITEVFVNLLTNAIEAIERSHRTEGEITISIWDEAPWFCVSIRDNGCGISPNLRKKIFQPLFSTKKNFNNWGIGLSHVKNVVLAHSGYINLKSVKNVYSEFQVTLLLESSE